MAAVSPGKLPCIAFMFDIFERSAWYALPRLGYV